MAKITAKLRRIWAATAACIPPIWRFFPVNTNHNQQIKQQSCWAAGRSADVGCRHRRQ
jgi:hypothetical protein